MFNMLLREFRHNLGRRVSDNIPLKIKELIIEGVIDGTLMPSHNFQIDLHDRIYE